MTDRHGDTCNACGCPNYPYLRLATVAALLGIPRRTLSYLCATSRLRASKLGGSWRINHDDLDRHVRLTSNNAAPLADAHDAPHGRASA